jgi:hypothetical protein
VFSQLSARAGRLESSALEHLEDQLLVLAALAADEQAEALQRGSLDSPESEGAVHSEDLLSGGVAQLDLRGQEIAHAPRGGGARLARHPYDAPRAAAK